MVPAAGLRGVVERLPARGADAAPSVDRPLNRQFFLPALFSFPSGTSAASGRVGSRCLLFLLAVLRPPRLSLLRRAPGLLVLDSVGERALRRTRLDGNALAVSRPVAFRIPRTRTTPRSPAPSEPCYNKPILASLARFLPASSLCRRPTSKNSPRPPCLFSCHLGSADADGPRRRSGRNMAQTGLHPAVAHSHSRHRRR